MWCHVQIIAKRLLESKQLIPHYYITVDITMDEVMRYVCTARDWYRERAVTDALRAPL